MQFVQVIAHICFSPPPFDPFDPFESELNVRQRDSPTSASLLRMRVTIGTRETGPRAATEEVLESQQRSGGARTGTGGMKGESRIYWKQEDRRKEERKGQRRREMRSGARKPMNMILYVRKSSSVAEIR